VEQLADRLLEKQFLMVDVHVPYEGEIPGTDTSISYLELDALQACIGADRGRDVVLTCMSDHMSTVAGEELLRRGYRNLSHVVGGMRAWQAAGHPLAWRDGGAAACP
jgi:rhodanese-related sulfurtransferase